MKPCKIERHVHKEKLRAINGGGGPVERRCFNLGCQNKSAAIFCRNCFQQIPGWRWKEICLERDAAKKRSLMVRTAQGICGSAPAPLEPVTAQDGGPHDAGA